MVEITATDEDDASLSAFFVTETMTITRPPSQSSLSEIAENLQTTTTERDTGLEGGSGGGSNEGTRVRRNPGKGDLLKSDWILLWASVFGSVAVAFGAWIW